MARLFILQDDLDGTQGAQTHTFALDSDEREIDLGEDNYARLRELLQPFFDASRRVTKTGRVVSTRSRTPRLSRPTEPVKAPTTSNGNGSHAPASDNKAIRDWAQRRGVPVASQGRISQSVKDQYAAEGGNKAAQSLAAALATPAPASVPAKAAGSRERMPAEAHEVYAQVGGNLDAFVDHFEIAPAKAKRWIAKIKKATPVAT